MPDVCLANDGANFAWFATKRRGLYDTGVVQVGKLGVANVNFLSLNALSTMSTHGRRSYAVRLESAVHTNSAANTQQSACGM